MDKLDELMAASRAVLRVSVKDARYRLKRAIETLDEARKRSQCEEKCVLCQTSLLRGEGRMNPQLLQFVTRLVVQIDTQEDWDNGELRSIILNLLLTPTLILDNEGESK